MFFESTRQAMKNRYAYGAKEKTCPAAVANRLGPRSRTRKGGKPSGRRSKLGMEAPSRDGREGGGAQATAANTAGRTTPTWDRQGGGRSPIGSP